MAMVLKWPVNLVLDASLSKPCCSKPCPNRAYRAKVELDNVSAFMFRCMNPGVKFSVC